MTLSPAAIQLSRTPAAPVTCGVLQRHAFRPGAAKLGFRLCRHRVCGRQTRNSPTSLPCMLQLLEQRIASGSARRQLDGVSAQGGSGSCGISAESWWLCRNRCARRAQFWPASGRRGGGSASRVRPRPCTPWPEVEDGLKLERIAPAVAANRRSLENAWAFIQAEGSSTSPCGPLWPLWRSPYSVLAAAIIGPDPCRGLAVLVQSAGSGRRRTRLGAVRQRLSPRRRLPSASRLPVPCRLSSSCASCGLNGIAPVLRGHGSRSAVHRGASLCHVQRLPASLPGEINWSSGCSISRFHVASTELRHVPQPVLSLSRWDDRQLPCSRPTASPASACRPADRQTRSGRFSLRLRSKLSRTQ